MATHLVTGYAGVEHVAAADDATLHASMVGKGKYVFDSGSNFAYEVVSNNLIKIKDGDLMNQGRHIKIAANDYEELEIDNGIAGVKRYDLIVCRYTKDVDTSIESASLVVVKGTSSATPTDPTINSGDIFGGDLVDDFPLYRVCLDGLDIVGVDCLFEVAPNNVGNMAEIGKMKQAINQASKSWIIPDDTTIDVFDIGEPGEKYPVSKYDGKLYLDVASGTVYACSNEEWTVNATLTSVQDELASAQEEITNINSSLEKKIISSSSTHELSISGRTVTLAITGVATTAAGVLGEINIPSEYQPSITVQTIGYDSTNKVYITCTVTPGRHYVNVGNLNGLIAVDSCRANMSWTI